MDKNILLKSAQSLKQVSAEAAAEYHQKIDLLTVKINSMMLERPDIKDLVGSDNIALMKDNHANHARFIASILKNLNHEVLVESVLWVFRAYRSHGFKTSYWAAQLNAWMIILKNELSPECYEEVYPYYEWMQTNIPLFVNLTES